MPRGPFSRSDTTDAALLIGFVTIGFALSVLLGFGWRDQRRLAADARTGGARESVRALERVSNEWLGAHPGQCPTVARLVQDQTLAPSATSDDPWGHPYVIRCDASGAHASSSGPDGIPDTPDDILPR